MSLENPTWGAPRIKSELALLDHNVPKSTVAKYMVRQPKPPSQTWRTFLENHVGQIVAIDFFTVPTASFRVLYVFLILRHERRRIVHFNVTPIRLLVGILTALTVDSVQQPFSRRMRSSGWTT